MPDVDDRVSSGPAESALDATADIVVGIPTYNNAETIGHAVLAAQSGLKHYFPSNRSVIVTADGGSKDGTPEAAFSSAIDKDGIVQVTYPVFAAHKLSDDYHGIPGRGNAFRAVFAEARRLHARACALVDSDTQAAITPEWVQTLVRPVADGGFDLVVSRYQRHKYDGLIINGVVYPVLRALYGKRLRQPVGGDFVFSAELLEHYLAQQTWNGELTGGFIDLWIMVEAICGGFHIADALLGPRPRSPKDLPADLSAVLESVLGSLFDEMARTAGVWQRTRGSEAVPAMGRHWEPDLDATPPDVDRMIESFHLGYQNLWEIWSMILSPATLMEWKRLAGRPKEQFQLTNSTWVRTVYDFSSAYRIRTIDRHHLLQALTPLYLGWAASYVLQLVNAGPEEAEQRLESLSTEYEQQKKYLISRWRWPDRFNP